MVYAFGEEIICECRVHVNVCACRCGRDQCEWCVHVNVHAFGEEIIYEW